VAVQDRCTVCAKCTIGSDIALDAYDSTPMSRGPTRSNFGLFGDSANLNTRLVHGLRRKYRGSEVILDAHDGTPR
jgi:hypothetical protein